MNSWNSNEVRNIQTLYFALGTCALASQIALLDARADYELKRVDTGVGEQRSPDYLALNPKGRIPTLVTPQGSLSETPAILAFIAQSDPKQGSRRSMIPSPSLSSRPSTATFVRRSTWPTPTACAAPAGPTIQSPSKP